MRAKVFNGSNTLRASVKSHALIADGAAQGLVLWDFIGLAGDIPSVQQKHNWVVINTVGKYMLGKSVRRSHRTPKNRDSARARGKNSQRSDNQRQSEDVVERSRLPAAIQQQFGAVPVGAATPDATSSSEAVAVGTGVIEEGERAPKKGPGHRPSSPEQS